jgi:hypothetical protein
VFGRSDSFLRSKGLLRELGAVFSWSGSGLWGRPYPSATAILPTRRHEPSGCPVRRATLPRRDVSAPARLALDPSFWRVSSGEFAVPWCRSRWWFGTAVRRPGVRRALKGPWKARFATEKISCLCDAKLFAQFLLYTTATAFVNDPAKGYCLLRRARG